MKTKKTKKTKVEELTKFADGKTYVHPVNGVSSTGKRTLNEILGINVGTYKVADEAEYAESLAQMNKADMIRECLRLGINPNDSRDIMTARLLKEFRIHEAQIKSAPVKPVVLSAKPETLKILKKGANDSV